MSQVESLQETIETIQQGLVELEKELGIIDNRELWDVPVIYYKKKGRSLKTSKVKTYDC